MSACNFRMQGFAENGGSILSTTQPEGVRWQSRLPSSNWEKVLARLPSHCLVLASSNFKKMSSKFIFFIPDMTNTLLHAWTLQRDRIKILSFHLVNNMYTEQWTCSILRSTFLFDLSACTVLEFQIAEKCLGLRLMYIKHVWSHYWNVYCNMGLKSGCSVFVGVTRTNLDEAARSRQTEEWCPCKPMSVGREKAWLCSYVLVEVRETVLYRLMYHVYVYIMRQHRDEFEQK